MWCRTITGRTIISYLLSIFIVLRFDLWTALEDSLIVLGTFVVGEASRRMANGKEGILLVHASVWF